MPHIDLERLAVIGFRAWTGSEAAWGEIGEAARSAWISAVSAIVEALGRRESPGKVVVLVDPARLVEVVHRSAAAGGHGVPIDLDELNDFQRESYIGMAAGALAEASRAAAAQGVELAFARPLAGEYDLARPDALVGIVPDEKPTRPIWLIPVADRKRNERSNGNEHSGKVVA